MVVCPICGDLACPINSELQDQVEVGQLYRFYDDEVDDFAQLCRRPSQIVKLKVLCRFHSIFCASGSACFRIT